MVYCVKVGVAKLMGDYFVSLLTLYPEFEAVKIKGVDKGIK